MRLLFEVDKLTGLFSEEGTTVVVKLLTSPMPSESIVLGCPGVLEDYDCSSLKEQSLVREMKVCSHLKILRIAPGNWRMVGVA